MKKIRVNIDIDVSRFVAAMRGAAHTTRLAGRAMWRAGLTPGERHIDRMCREVAGKPDAALRLFVAAGCVAPVLDRREP